MLSAENFTQGAKHEEQQTVADQDFCLLACTENTAFSEDGLICIFFYSTITTIYKVEPVS